MARFNHVAKPSAPKVVNLAGGQAHQQSLELELVSLLFTSFASNKFYQSGDDTINRLKQLINKCDPYFVAQAAIYARNEYGMRSISHVAASELGMYIRGEEWATRFYDKIIRRVDDITEILAYHLGKKEKLSNAMRKGMGNALGRYDAYGLAKYKGGTKEITLVDAVNILHPKPTAKNKEALAQLMKGTLKSFDTWESELSKAGQKGGTADEVLTLKAEVWTDMIMEGKLGYFALLRNLRNILQIVPDMAQFVYDQLVDVQAIKKSLVFPFRFLAAYKEISSLPGDKYTRLVLKGIEEAMDISLANVPEFPGDTLCVIDTSGSMHQAMSDKSGMMLNDVAAIFTAVIAKKTNGDIMEFNDRARYVNYTTTGTTMQIVNSFRFSSGGTDFHTIFNAANKKYDRIIILSDMQGWVEYTTPHAEFAAYKKRYSADPFIFSFDLAGHGTMQFPENKVFAMAGFSDKTLSLMSQLETDKNAMINMIKAVVI